MAAWRYEKYFTLSQRSLLKCLPTLKEKFRISARICNVVYIDIVEWNDKTFTSMALFDYQPPR